MRPIVSILVLFVLVMPAVADQPLHAGQSSNDALQLQAHDDYQAYCATCHGTQSKSPGSIAPGLALVDFTTPQAVGSLTRENMIAGVSEHHSTETKRTWNTLGDSRIADIIDYIRASALGPEPATAMGQDTMADAGGGGKIYARSCSVCHGERGNAASWAKNSLNPPPRDFTRSRSDELSRHEMINAVTHGVDKTAMMSFTTQMTDEEIATVIDFIRAEFMPLRSGGTGPESAQVSAEAAGHAMLPQKHEQIASTGHHAEHGHSPQAGEFDRDAPFAGALIGDAAKGHRFYESNCAECHGLNGNGEGPRAYFMARKPRDFTSARARADLNRPHLFLSVAKGIRRSEMAAWSKVLTDQQIADVAEYVFRAFIAPEESALPAQEPHDAHDEHPHKKKTLSCEQADGPDHTAGRRIYNARCYFCHGYSGDARTVAAGLLDPPPRDFQSSPDLSRAAVLKALRDGRPGTAMRDFQLTLDAAEIASVADFVLREFVLCRRENTFYHTPANGWSDHEARYGAAYPFVLGTLDIDSEEAVLNERQQAGRALYRESCVICHDSFAIGTARQRPRAASQTTNAIAEGPGPLAAVVGERPEESQVEDGHSPNRGDHDHDDDDHDDDEHDDHEYEYEYASPHDIAPEIAGLTPAESRGEVLYQVNCAQCHAADGTAENWIGRFLNPQPTDFTAAETERRLDDTALRRAIVAGLPGSSMPAFRDVIQEREVDDIIAYLRRAFLRD